MFALLPHQSRGMTIWVTGMPCAGKRTLAHAIADRLRKLQKPVEVLDGPEWTSVLGEIPGINPKSHADTVRRVITVAAALTRAGGVVIVPILSHKREWRELARQRIGRFLEVFVDPFTGDGDRSFALLAQRDTTGTYRRAMTGELQDVIGVDLPYETHKSADVTYDSGRQSIDTGTALVMAALVREGMVTEAELKCLQLPDLPPEAANDAPVVDPTTMEPAQAETPASPIPETAVETQPPVKTKKTSPQRPPEPPADTPPAKSAGTAAKTKQTKAVTAEKSLSDKPKPAARKTVKTAAQSTESATDSSTGAS